MTRILVPLDGSSLAERALPYAVALARAAGARLTLFHARPPSGSSDEPGFDPTPVAERLLETGLVLETLVYPIVGDETSQAICEAAREQDATSIVMSTHGRGGLGRWLYGSVADQVLRQADRPVLLVTASCDHPWPTDRPLRVLVALDGSILAERALGPAATVTDWLRAEVLLLRAVDGVPSSLDFELPLTPLFPPAAAGGADARAARFDGAREYLEGIAGDLRTPARSVETQVVEGRAGPMIATIARERQVDLIAMATHGRGGAARLVLGSVATETLHRARVPLLLVRANEAYAPPDVESEPAADRAYDGA